jgi:chorismate dehydratase
VTIRVPIVDYLNAAPLAWSFLHGPHRDLFELVPMTPGSCADRLAAGDVQLSMIPSIEYQRIPNLLIVPGMSIAAIKEVRSVLLIRPKKPRPIRSVALDTSSRTSVVLVTLLLRLRMGLQPDLVSHPPDLEGMLRLCDAALLIGDTALRVPREEYEVTDLAAAWHEWQRKPFVFSFWACRADSGLPAHLSTVLREAKEWGLKMRSRIAEVYSRSLNLPHELLDDYLRNNINYDLGSDHAAALECFYRLAHESGLTPRDEPLRFLAD